MNRWMIWQRVRTTMAAEIAPRIAAETGASLVLLALTLTVLLGFVGLAVDGSNAYYQQQRMQIAADAGAFAGARQLAQDASSTVAQGEAQTLAQLNGADAITVIVTLDEGDRTIAVTANRTFDTYFARILGGNLDTFSVSATARAGTIVVGQAGGLMPMTIKCPVGPTTCFEYGESYNLWDDDPNQPGNLGWVRWNDAPGETSEQVLVENIINPGDSRVLAIGGVAYGTTGAKPSNDVREALKDLIGRTVTIPIYSTVTGEGNGAVYTISGFAQFVVSGVDLTGNNKHITGRFVRNAAPGEVFENAPDYGTRDVRMLQ